MARGYPHLRIHENGAIQPHVIRALAHELFPPSLLYVVLHFYAQRTVIPRVGKAAVDLGTRIDKAPTFA